MLVTDHLLRKTPSSPGLTVRLQFGCEPRRRDRLPEEAMSEGAQHRKSFALLRLRLSDQRRPTLPRAAGPERADEGGRAPPRGGSAGVESRGLRAESLGCLPCSRALSRRRPLLVPTPCRGSRPRWGPPA